VKQHTWQTLVRSRVTYVCTTINDNAGIISLGIDPLRVDFPLYRHLEEITVCVEFAESPRRTFYSRTFSLPWKKVRRLRRPLTYPPNKILYSLAGVTVFKRKLAITAPLTSSNKFPREKGLKMNAQVLSS
jgi:hypothetical protein